MARRVGLLGLVVVFAAGCGGGGSSAGSSVTLDFGTTVASASSTVVVPLTVESTVSATTEAPTTTAELVTTTTLSKKAEVEAAFMQTMAVRDRCDFDPGNCDFGAVAVRDSPQDLYTRRSIQRQIDANLRPVIGFGDIQFRVEDITVGGDVAYLDVCSFDNSILFDIVDPANPADDIVFNDEVESNRTRWEMRQKDGVWLQYNGVTQESKRDGDICDF